MKDTGYEEAVIKKIREELEKDPVPESLRPPQIVDTLQKMQPADLGKAGQGGRRGMYGWLTAGAVAAACILVAVSASLFQRSDALLQEETDPRMAQEAAVYEQEQDLAQVDETQDGAVQERPVGNADVQAGSKRRNAGTAYQIADSYEEVYALLQKSDAAYKYATNGVVEEAADVDRGTGTHENETGSISAAMDLSGGAQKQMADMQTGSYSTTNVQVTGVDESDIIKTDGRYIYTVTGYGVAITDIRGEKLKALADIRIPQSGAARIMEMYVDGNLLQLIVQTSETELTQQDTEDIQDVYSFDSRSVTKVLSYDISRRSDPRLSASVSQDGSYVSSRKIGSTLYLMTEQYLARQSQETTYLGAEDDYDYDFVPLVNEKRIAADCIYLPESGNRGLVISSFADSAPTEAVDSVMIVNDNAQMYVSAQSLYLYHTNYNYTNDLLQTEVAKFSLENGRIDAVGAASVRGCVTDTFAVNETDGQFRILTTDWSADEDENALYLFDENMGLTGSLTGLARGEEIYAARFMGDMAYFVTYRNTDPLFAVDLSDTKNPKVLSELKITGFSEYLHFWGDDKLLGIGYETDPDTGERKGIKLSMFDISDPAQLSVIASAVIEDVYDSPAMSAYKSVLVSRQENVIGFAAGGYNRLRRKYEYKYLLFSFEDGAFRNVTAQPLEECSNVYSCRGMYSGDTFFICDPDGIASYDRKNGYEQLDILKIE